jgi:seryl-tRNA synthetase
MKNVLLFALLTFACACGGKDEKAEATLKEAARLHNEAVAIHDSLMPMMKEINMLKVALVAQKDSLTGKNDSLAGSLQTQIAALDAVSQEMRTWMENIVEVPGNEHHHHHEGEAHKEGEAHDHEHGKKVDVTPEQMLEIQKEIKANILKIKDKVIQLKKS